jgi:hypothetical protein
MWLPLFIQPPTDADRVEALYGGQVSESAADIVDPDRQLAKSHQIKTACSPICSRALARASIDCPASMPVVEGSKSGVNLCASRRMETLAALSFAVPNKIILLSCPRMQGSGLVALGKFPLTLGTRDAYPDNEGMDSSKSFVPMSLAGRAAKPGGPNFYQVSC